ncbi:MAG: glycosyltransferase family 2 protein, partial [Prevotella sp.]|nr:glycosyltransferase family 2 protein [Prevotella sp.]
MKLSVIIPAYRVEKTLSKCVHSITEMSFSDYELILVDDCSPDRTGSICDELAKENRRIHVIHKNKNEGLSQARNEGIEQAQGEYVTFIDSDDYLKKGTFDELISLINDHPEYDIIEYPSYLHYGSDRQKMLMFSPCEYTDKRDYWYDCHAYEHTYAWNKIYKTCLFNSIRFPVGMVFEDVY